MNNPILDVTWFGGCGMTRISGDQKTKMKWTDLVETLSKHLITDQKDGLMFNCWHFSGSIRNSESCDYLSALIIDVDGEQSISEAKEYFAEFEHFGYTSFGHNTESKGYSDCFRIILPLAKPVSKAQLEKKRWWLKENIKCDPSSFSISRAFYAPSCLAENTFKKQNWYNEGNLFDLLRIDDEVIKVYVGSGKDNNQSDKIQTLIDNLANYHVGYEPTWATIAWVMASNDFTYSDFQRVSNGCMDSKDESAIRNKWQAAKRQAGSKPANGIGYLYNVLKGKHDGK